MRKRKFKCSNGNTVERFMDRGGSRSFVTRVLDSHGNQVGDADYSGTKKSADWAWGAMVRDNTL